MCLAQGHNAVTLVRLEPQPLYLETSSLPLNHSTPFNQYQEHVTQMQVITPCRRQLKTPILSRNVDQKSLQTEFSIGICRHTGDK